MKMFLRSKLAIGILFFFLGFGTNHLLTKIYYRSALQIVDYGGTEQVSINPDDFDHDKLMDAARKMKQEMRMAEGVERREDDQFVYYDIQLNARERRDSELKVNVNNKIITIIETTEDVQSMREFNIEPGLDEGEAQVLHSKDKVSVKIPKKATI